MRLRFVVCWGSLSSRRRRGAPPARYKLSLVSAARRRRPRPPRIFADLFSPSLISGRLALWQGFFARTRVRTSRGTSSAPQRCSGRAHGSAPGPGGPAPGEARLSLQPPWRAKKPGPTQTLGDRQLLPPLLRRPAALVGPYRRQRGCGAGLVGWRPRSKFLLKGALDPSSDPWQTSLPTNRVFCAASARRFPASFPSSQISLELRAKPVSNCLQAQ